MQDNDYSKDRLINDPILDKSNDLIGTVHAISDVTERKRAEETLKANQNLLQTVIETEPECVKLLASDGALLMMNRAGLAMIEADSLDQVKGRSVYPLISPEYREAFEALTDDVFQGKSGTLQFEMVGIKGRRLWLDTHVVPLRNERDEIIALLGITRDITEEKRAKDALRESEEQYRDLFESASDLIQIVRPDGRLHYVNRAWRETFGYSEEEIAGLSLFDIIHPDCGAHCSETFQLVLSEGRVPKIETIFVAKDGRRILVEGSATCKFMNGRPVSTRCIFRDVTEKKKKEEELFKAQKLESLGFLAGGIAHDFNNLLQVILGNISLAKLHVSAQDEIYRLLDSAERASLRAADITGHLITFSKGGGLLKERNFIKELIKDTVRFSLSGSDIRCEFAIAGDLWPAEFDEAQMRRVIQNMVMNAKEAMREGGALRTAARNISINGKEGLPLRAGNYIEISLRDNGVGIPKENLSRIFDPYFTTKEMGNHKGMGLGLAICYSIIKNHDGLITVESEAGVGTTFHLYLPASQEGLPERRIVERPSVCKGKALIMDDEETIRDIAGEMLKHIGYEVEFAKDGMEAIALYEKAKVSREPFDVVILDVIVQGGMGGKKTIESLLEIDPHVEAIVSSGDPSDSVMTGYREHGFKALIIKPYNIEELSRTVAMVMGELS